MHTPTTPVSVAAARQPSTSWPLASLSLSMLLSALGTSIANVGLPTLADAFAASFQAVQWVVLAYLLAITTLIVSVGRLGDLVGRRRLLLAGIFLFTAASALCAAAPSLWLLVSARVLQGTGAAVMMALTLAFVGDAIPKEKTGRAMGLLGTMSAVGTALGPSLGGLLIAKFGWPALFLVNVPLGVLSFLLVRRFLPAGDAAVAPRPAGFDLLGTVVLALTLAAYALAMTLGRGAFGAVNLALLLAAAAGAGVFALVEARAASPLVRIAMFRDKTLSAGFAMSALVTTVVMASLVVGPFYLSGALGLDAGQAGLVMSAGPAVAALVGMPAGRGVDRYGAQPVVIFGLVAMAAGAALLATVPVGFGIAGYVGPLAVITAGFALFQAANNTAVMTNSRPDQRGVVSGLLNLSRNLGLITGASAMGAVFTLGAGSSGLNVSAPGAATAGMRLTFAVASGLAGISLAIAAAACVFGRRRVVQAGQEDARG